MPRIRHVNVQDSQGRIYCCLRNRIVTLDERQRSGFCRACPMYAGDAGGRGAECVWDDWRAVPDPYLVPDPAAEYRCNQQRKLKPGAMAVPPAP